MPRIKSGWFPNKAHKPLRVGQYVKLLEGVGQVTNANDCSATVMVGAALTRIARCSEIPVWEQHGRRKQLPVITNQEDENASTEV